MMTPQDTETFTYRGRSLEELVPRIRSELGDDAVIVARRETASGGVGGFFAKREIEVEVRPGQSWQRPARFATAADAFAAQLEQAQERQQLAGGADVVVPRAGGVVVAPAIDALGGRDRVSDVSVDDLFPAPPAEAQRGLAAMFNAGLQQTAPPPPDVSEPVVPEAPSLPEPPAEAVDQPTGMFDYLGAGPASVDAESEPAAEPEAEAEPEPEPRPEVEPEPEPVVAEPVYEGPARLIAPAPVELPGGVRKTAERLVSRGLRAGLAEAIAEEAVVGLAPLLPDADPKDLVVDALARRIPQHPLRRGPGVIGFVGPGGAGKTRCVARLAAAYARHGALPVSVLALRAPDEGAELTRLLAPYDVALHAVDSGAEGAARIAALRGEGLVIVDTPGVSPRSSAELRGLGDELRSLAPDELHLTVMATVGPDAARELVRGVRELGVSAVAVTHTDETEILGTVIGLAIDCGLPLSYLARGQAVEAGLRPVSAAALAADLAP